MSNTARQWASSPFILPLDEAEPGRCGGKAANLARMRRLGLPVPPGMVVTTDAFEAFLGADGLRGIRMRPVLGLFPFDFAGQIGYWYALSVAALVFAGLAALTRSAFGLSLRGIHESPARMAAIGVSVYAAAVVALGGVRVADLRAALRRGA